MKLGHLCYAYIQELCLHILARIFKTKLRQVNTQGHYSQQAVVSSDPSLQSLSLLHSLDFSMQICSLAQRNLESGQAMAVQLSSSEPSGQSLCPSQCHRRGMHRALAHRNWSS